MQTEEGFRFLDAEDTVVEQQLSALNTELKEFHKGLTSAVSEVAREEEAMAEIALNAKRNALSYARKHLQLERKAKHEDESSRQQKELLEALKNL